MTVLPDGAVQLRPTEAGMLIARRAAAVEQSLEIVRRRVDQVGVAEPTIQRVGADRILVQLPGVQDPSRDPRALGTTAKLSFHQCWPRPSPDGAAAAGLSTCCPTRTAAALSGRSAQPMLHGERLTDARAGFDQQTGQPIVTFRFDSVGARRFAEITRAQCRASRSPSCSTARC